MSRFQLRAVRHWFGPGRAVWRAATLAWVACLLWLTLRPDDSPNTNNLIPFVDHAQAFYCVLTRCPYARACLYFLLIDLLGNLAVFVPLGVGLAGWLCRGREPWRCGLLAALGGLALSATVESIQIGIPTRAGDTTDIILNTLGTALGALFWLRWSRRQSEKQRP
jgi:glycopeptide antibiotics resistance protein